LKIVISLIPRYKTLITYGLNLEREQDESGREN